MWSVLFVSCMYPKLHKFEHVCGYICTSKYKLCMCSPTQHMMLRYLLLATSFGLIGHLQANLQKS